MQQKYKMKVSPRHFYKEVKESKILAQLAGGGVQDSCAEELSNF